VKKRGSVDPQPWVPILGYHRVVESLQAGDNPQVTVTAKRLESQMRWFARLGYRCTSLEAVAESLAERRPLPPRRFVVTFDDGYADTLTTAVPILAGFGFTATVFVVSGLVGETNVWDAGVSPPARLMGWGELSVLLRNGFSIGSHTKSHRRLSQLSMEEVWVELAESRQALQSRLATDVRTFCYPWGDWSPRVRGLVQEAGYLAACDDVGRTENALFTLARVDPTYWFPPLTPLVRSRHWYFHVQRQPALRGLVGGARQLVSRSHTTG
jgi:peptidoglycan/xylan/chitin deacetylase (PgdA/CDA1 family)